MEQGAGDKFRQQARKKSQFKDAGGVKTKGFKRQE
jgi:hypothetical protein